MTIEVLDLVCEGLEHRHIQVVFRCCEMASGYTEVRGFQNFPIWSVLKFSKTLLLFSTVRLTLIIVTRAARLTLVARIRLIFLILFMVLNRGISFGISTIYLATAVRDNGGGIVVGTEIVHDKVVQARKNITEAGLETYVDIREGDALETLKTFNQTVDLVLIDGWTHLALDVLKIINPLIRIGGIVVSDNVNTFKDGLKSYVEFLQNPANGYRTSTLNFKGGTEFSVKVAFIWLRLRTIL